MSLERAGAVALRGMHAHALALHGEVGRAKEELSQALTPGVDRTDSIVGSKLDEVRCWIVPAQSWLTLCTDAVQIRAPSATIRASSFSPSCLRGPSLSWVA